MSKRLEAHLSNVGILAELIRSDVLPGNAIDHFWALEVTEAKTSTSRRNNLWRFNVTVPEYQQVVLSDCGKVKFSIGEDRRAGAMELWFIQGIGSSRARNNSWSCYVKGAVSLILPQTGLTPMLNKKPTVELGMNVIDSDRLRNPRFKVGMAPLLPSDDTFVLPLNGSSMQFNHNGSVRVTPDIDLSDHVFSLGKAGLLMSFDRLSFVCRNGKPHINLRGGKLYAIRSAE